MPDAAKYKSIATSLRQDILDGKYGVGERLPSIRALMCRLKVSNLAVQHALVELEKEGLVVCRRGAGSFVTRVGASRNIGLITPGIARFSEFFQPIVTELGRLASGADYSLLTGDGYPEDPEECEQFVIDQAARFIRGHVAGVIFQPLERGELAEPKNRRILSAFSRAGIPVVLLDSEALLPPARSSYDLVSIDNNDAAQTLALHMLDAGAHTICFQRVPNLSSNVLKRIQGVMGAVISRGGCWSEENVLVAEPADIGAVRRYLRRHRSVDAIICDCDVTAAKLKQTLDLLGIRVPADVMLGGFDDVRIAPLMSPPLTTMHQPCADLAREAFSRLLARIHNPNILPVEIFLCATLVRRASTDHVQHKARRKALR